MPLVSVCMTTYNHERYIAQAIESVLRQQTDFAVEVVVGEDYIQTLHSPFVVSTRRNIRTVCE